MALRYVAAPEEASGADVILIPGSKTTLEDLAYLREKGFGPLVQGHVQRGGELVGICGGFQMLGRQIADPDAVESGGQGEGFGFLHLTTTLRRDKITEQVEAHALHICGTTVLPVQGYLIHVGRTDRHGHRPCFQLRGAREPSPLGGGVASQNDESLDGAVRDDGLVWGTYIHGLFDQPAFRRAWLNRLRTRKGLSVADLGLSQGVNDKRRDALDRWADHVEEHLAFGPILERLR